VSSPAPAASTTLRDGRYVLVAPLGAGAQAATWDAIDRREGRPVAIKRFDVRGARAWKDVELAEREARVLATLSHPRLPRYLEHFEEDGALYLVMEKIEGEPLSEIARRGPVSQAEVERLLRDADDVLTYLHGRAPAVVHRDIKPANVIRRPDGSFAFVDFGSVRERLRPEGGSTVVGTFGFMAPEQFQGRAGPGSDVYAVGATAITLLTGVQPEELPHRGLSIDVDAALHGRAGRRLQGALERMLEIDPDRRPTRIGPLLSGEGGREFSRHERRRAARAEVADFSRRVRDAALEEAGLASDAAWKEPRLARKAARREARLARAGRWRGPPWLFIVLLALQVGVMAKIEPNPWLIVGVIFAEMAVFGVLRWVVGLVLRLGLRIAQLVVGLVLGVVVPLVLVILSVVAGPALRVAAGRVRRASSRANEAMGGARRRLRVGAVGGEEPRRVRVSADEPETAASDLEHEEEREELDERGGPRGYGSRGGPVL
jgi:hypothetical protein